MPKLSHFKKVVLVVTVGQRREKVGTNVFKFLVPTENLMSSLRLDWNIIDDHHHRAASIEVLSKASNICAQHPSHLAHHASLATFTHPTSVLTPSLPSNSQETPTASFYRIYASWRYYEKNWSIFVVSPQSGLFFAFPNQARMTRIRYATPS